MKRKTLIVGFLLTAFTLVSQASDLVLPAGMKKLTGDDVTVVVESTRAIDKKNNLVVAGSKERGYKAFFVANTFETGNELWVSDGTEAGTHLVKDIFPGTTSSDIAWMQRFNDKVVFQAQANLDDGVELWISDGTAAGTKMIKDIHPFGSSYPGGFTQVNETQFIFGAINYESETYSGEAQKWLWVSDGTEDGTKLIYECSVMHPGATNANDNATHFCRVGRKVFFKADSKDGEYGEELWVTDGTEAGTLFLGDLNKNIVDENTGATAGSQIDWMTNFYNEKLFFKAYTIEDGAEPFVSDGTVAGTHLIKDITPGFNANGLPNGGGTYAARVFKDKVYFRGTDPTYGAELYVSDLTAEGTYMVKDFNKNPKADGSGTLDGFPDLFCEFDGVLFMKANSGGLTGAEYEATNKGLELFYTDGTTEGTIMQSDLNPGVGNNAAWEGTTISGSFYFRAQDKTPVGSQLWELFKIDSKDEFPVKVVDLVSGQDFVHSFRNMGGDLVFTSVAVPSFFVYHYRKANYNPETDVDNLEPNYEIRGHSSIGESIDSKENNSLKIYPNPIKDSFTFNVDGVAENIKIYNTLGKLVSSINSLTSNQVNIGNLNDGVYYVLVKTTTGIFSAPIIVQK